MVTAAAWAVTLTVLAACATYAAAVTRGHTGGPGCLRRAAAFHATRAAYVTVIWAVRRVRRVRAERGRT